MRERLYVRERERDWERGQSKAVVVLYRGNDLGLEGQDTNSEARDIYKYIIYIYIFVSHREFSVFISSLLFFTIMQDIYIYIYIYISFFLLQCKQGGLNQKLAETGSRYFQNPFKEFTDSLSASPFVFSLSLLISLCLSLFFPSCFWRSVCVCVYIWTQTVPTGFKEYRSTVLFWGATPNQTQKPFFFFFFLIIFLFGESERKRV